MTSTFERAVPSILAQTQPRPGFFEALLNALRQMSSGRMGIVEPEPRQGGRGAWLVGGAAAGAAAASGLFLGLRRHRRGATR